jgi:hypothetical protein
MNVSVDPERLTLFCGPGSLFRWHRGSGDGVPEITSCGLLVYQLDLLCLAELGYALPIRNALNCFLIQRGQCVYGCCLLGERLTSRLPGKTFLEARHYLGISRFTGLVCCRTELGVEGFWQPQSDSGVAVICVHSARIYTTSVSLFYLTCKQCHVTLFVTLKKCLGVLMKDRYRSQIRLPQNLAQWLRDKAKAEGRSMNGQLVYELERMRWREQEAA